jgi:GNAT superfamily N-acetyltransferase
MSFGMSAADSASLVGRDFDGSYSRLAEMIQRSWRDNGEDNLFYSADYLANQLTYPDAGPLLCSTAYDDGELVGFFAGLPRTALLKGSPCKLLVSSFLTVAEGYKGRGVARELVGELATRGARYGYDGIIMYAVEGGPMNHMVLGAAKTLGIPAVHFQRVPYLSRLLFPKKLVEAGPTMEEREAAELLMALAAPMQDRAELSRVWTIAEAEWQIGGRLGAVTAAVEHGSRKGLLTGSVLEIADRNRTKCLFVDDLLWQELDDEERTSLLKALLDKAATVGAQIAVVPQLGYADMEPFQAAKFRQSQRVLHGYLLCWDGRPLPDHDLKSVYLDAF